MNLQKARASLPPISALWRSFRLSSWLGWQIVRKYMNAHPKLELQDLLVEKDARKILQDSGYKPGKN